MKLSDDVLDILQLATFTSDSVTLTMQLDRQMYVKVNKALEAAGGKWNRKRKAHLFEQDPRELFDLFGESGGKINTQAISGDAIVKAAERGLQGKIVPGLFPTPPEIADQLVELAEIEEGMTVLEPSAGTGNILAAIDRADTFQKLSITAVEIDKRLADRLKNERPWMINKKFIHGDFLELGVGAYHLKPFDRIIMNPPFENGADIKHIKHAMTWLAEGGRLVAICAAGPRQWDELQPLSNSWIYLPDDAFKSSGTGVRTAIFVYDKPITRRRVERVRKAPAFAPATRQQVLF